MRRFASAISASKENGRGDLRTELRRKWAGMIALCEYELAPFLDEAAVAQVQGVVAIRVHDSTADYTDSQPGVAGVDPVTYAFGIARACSRDRIVVLKRLHRSLDRKSTR